MSSPPRCRTVERRDARPAGESADTDGADGEGRLVGTITLDETDRHRRRTAMSSDQGLAFVLDLESATRLRDGDRLVLEDGRRVVVRAAPEPLYEVRARDAHHLLRLAWHMGNRHLPTQLMADHLRIRRDRVIGDMLAGLGAELLEIEAGFDPEGGAYGDAGGAAHPHGLVGTAHSHGHSHLHGHSQPHEPERSSGHEHDPSRSAVPRREHAGGQGEDAHERADTPSPR